MTRQCDLGQVDVLEEGVDDPIHVLEEEQFKWRIPHIVPGVELSSILDAVDAGEESRSITCW